MPKNKQMMREVTFKTNQNIDRVLDKLRRKRPLGHLISDRSVRNIKKAAEIDRASVDLFLFRLQVLDRLAMTPNTISFPASFKRQDNLRDLSAVGLDYLVRLMGRARELNLGNAAFAGKLELEIAGPSLAAEIDEIVKNRNSIARMAEPDKEALGNRLLFRALLAARIELYHFEKEKSADPDHSSRGMKLMAEELNRLLNVFPFIKGAGEANYREAWKEEIEKARDTVERMSGASAEVVLVPLIVRVLEKMNEKETGRINRLKDKEEQQGLAEVGEKLNMSDRLYGKCILRTYDYAKRPDGGWELRPKNEVVPLYLAPSKFDRMLNEAEGEEEKNTGIIEELKMVAEDPLCWWHRLNLCLDRLSGVKEPRKKKALDELWGAAQLALIPKGPDRRLTAALTDAAITDLERRNEVLRIKIKKYPAFRVRAEGMMAGLLIELANGEAAKFARNDINLRNIGILKEMRTHLERYFGTLLAPASKDQREAWIGQARSHILGAVRLLNKLLENRSESAGLSQKRWAPEAPWNINAKHSAQAELDKRGLDKRIEELDAEYDGLVRETKLKIMRELLEIEFDVINRGEEWGKGQREKALNSFFRQKAGYYGAGIIPPAKTPRDKQLKLDL